MINFSIVMPSHNRREQLAKALSHLAGQTYPQELLEMVVVLDGCTDGSYEMLQQLRTEFPLELNIIVQPQSGPSAARNTGVRAARGEYILFLDDDVMATPELIAEHWRIHETDPAAVVVGTMSTPSDHQRPMWVRWEEYVLEKQYRDLQTGRYRMGPRQFYTGNCSLKRQLILEAGMFDENFKRYEDVELAFRLDRLGVKFYFNPCAIGYHYALRSYDSWYRAHYLYGVYAVKLDHEKGVRGMVETARREFKTRNLITQQLSYRLLNRPRLQEAVTGNLLRLSQAFERAGLERIGYRALSTVANMAFWQGFQEELARSPQPEFLRTPVKV